LCPEHSSPDIHVLPGSLLDYSSPFDLMFLSLVLETNHPLRESLWRRIPPPLYSSFPLQLGPVLSSNSEHRFTRPYVVALQEVNDGILGKLGNSVDGVWVWFILRSIYCYFSDPVRVRARYKIQLKAFLHPHTPSSHLHPPLPEFC